MDTAAVSGKVVSDEVLPARAYWHKRLDKGTVLRIVDLEGCQAVDTLIYDAADTAIRYNAANTMKLAKSIYLSKGCVLYDDLARPMMTIVEDTSAATIRWPATAAARSTWCAMVRRRSLSCRDNFIKAPGPSSAWVRGTFRQTSISS